jgi:ankyrin repeat protein
MHQNSYFLTACLHFNTGKSYNSMMSMPSLVSLCRDGNIAAVQQMIAEKCDVNVETDGSTPMRVAIETNNRELASILLDADATFPQLPTALLQLAIWNADIATLCIPEDEQILADGILDAACSGHRALVVSLISKFKPQRGGSILHMLPSMTQPEEIPLHKAAITLIVKECATLVDETDSFGFTALHIAAGFGNASVAAALVKAGADVNIVGKCEFSALMIASGACHVAVVKVLLAVGPALHIDAKQSDGRTALHMSVDASSVPVTAALLEARADVAAVCNKGRTPLFYASSADIATMLLNARADVNAANRAGVRAIFTAQNAEVARVLLDANADCNQRSQKGSTPLMHACFSGFTDVVKLFIAEGADVDIQDDFVPTLLILATNGGHLAVVELLLARSTATINARGEDGMTALFAAVKNDLPGVVDALIAAGADVNIDTNFGVTPLMMAKDGEMAQRLLDAGADITAATVLGRNSLAFAANYNRADVLKVLLQAPNAPVDWIDSLNDGYTLLMIASEKGATAVVEFLIQSGVNVDIQRARDHRTALCLTKSTDIARLLWNAGSKDTRVHERAGILQNACDSKSHDLVEFLLQCGFDVNVRHDDILDGSTPLMQAARRGDAEVLRVLLAADPPVNVNQQNQVEMTALIYAALSNRTTAVKMLLDAGANPRLTDDRGCSPLHYCRSAEAVALIVDAATTVLSPLRASPAYLSWRSCLDLVFDIISKSTRIIEMVRG